MITVDEALDRIFTRIPTPLPETVPLARAHQRVLARPLVARHTQPPFDASAMDGYAVRAADVVPGRPLFLAGTSQAGARFTGMMQQGECVRIFTGAPLPIGADAVIMQEEATAHGNQISFAATPEIGRSIRRRGFDFTEGRELLPAGLPLTPAMLNLAASANYPELTVTRRPTLALLATGDELVPPGSELGADQVVSSNTYALTPLLAPYCDKVLDLGIVPDDKRQLETAILGAFDAGVDILITSGGASVGERDYMQEVLRDLGVQLDFWKIRMRPGKPLMFGTRGRTLVFGLPGNPTAAFVTSTALVRPALRLMTGHTDPFWPNFSVFLGAGLPPDGPRRHFVRGTLRRNHGGLLEVMPIIEFDSNHSSSLALADCLIVQPENGPGLPAGEIVEIIPLNMLG